MPAPSLLHFGPYRLDGTRGQLWRHDAVVHLRPKALAVLWELARQVGQMVPKDLLLDTVWADTVVSEGVLTACIRDLRRALGDAARQPRYIETVHRRGYRFVAEVTACAAAALAAPDGATVSPGSPAAAAPAPLGTDDPPGTVAPPAVEPDDARAPVTGPLAPRAARPSAPLAETEHRHLTVLSCTFGDGERLTPPLDPEDAYDLMQTVRATTLAIITAHDGQVAQHGHEGVLVYFGYPQAHEDDAQRAVRSGLALVQALGQVGPAGRAGARAGLAVRIGIDTGMVLVPSGAGVVAQPSVAVGSPLTRAVRLGGLARSGTVVVSEATAQLVAGYVDCKAFSDPALADQHEM
ncbi:MAG TPA: winged helix-turn-helix domain-containing protein, partial [Candidatus Tectomicrobia bacterium]